MIVIIMSMWEGLGEFFKEETESRSNSFVVRRTSYREEWDTYEWCNGRSDQKSGYDEEHRAQAEGRRGERWGRPGWHVSSSKDAIVPPISWGWGGFRKIIRIHNSALVGRMGRLFCTGFQILGIAVGRRRSRRGWKVQHSSWWQDPRESKSCGMKLSIK